MTHYNWPWVEHEWAGGAEVLEIGRFRGWVQFQEERDVPRGLPWGWCASLEYDSPEGHDTSTIVHGTYFPTMGEAKAHVQEAILSEVQLATQALDKLRS